MAEGNLNDRSFRSIVTHPSAPRHMNLKGPRPETHTSFEPHNIPSSIIYAGAPRRSAARACKPVVA